MNRKLFWGGLAFVLFACVVILVVTNLGDRNKIRAISSELALVETHVNTSVEGTKLYEPTMENALKHSEYILSGKISGIKDEIKESILYSFTIEETIMGEIAEREIIIFGYGSEFEVGSEYILFLNVHSYTERPYDIYVYDDHFFFKIDNGEIQRLIDVFPFEEYISPFENEKYNNIDNFIKLLKDNTLSKKGTSERAKEKIDDYGTLYNKSHIVMEIKLSGLYKIDKYISEPIFTISETYKGDATDILFFLPTNLEIGENYLIFLEQTEDSFYSITTRQNSIFKVGTSEYKEVLSEIN
ncbi:hypothetical protein HYG86_12225 [Alkalicella caledoniensis]|uniref:Uncharacterized protein n=1 Tax=Alkalicella caledoniensis TaxID=2731377 RepID=A0A7G9W9W6_ALKCA|nr:hypothetical protein [Alkalicella caledoniensis]QNO15478.1 hypothetical protein HYG86_12225 [Alkalicella caledoniensis]